MDAIVLAFVAALFWGTAMVPIAKLKESPFKMAVINTTTAFFLTLTYFVFSGLVPSQADIIAGMITGVMWTMGHFGGLISMQNLGLGKSAAIHQPGQMIISFVGGVLIFNEFANGEIGIAALGVVILAAGAIVASKMHSLSVMKNTRVGYMAALGAAAAWGLHLAPMKWFGADPVGFVLPMTFTMMVITWIVFFAKGIKPQFSADFLKRTGATGTLWLCGNFAAVAAVSGASFAQVFPLTQTAVLVGACWAVFYLKEAKGKKAMLTLFAAAVLIVVGAYLLGTAQV